MDSFGSERRREPPDGAARVADDQRNDGAAPERRKAQAVQPAAERLHVMAKAHPPSLLFHDDSQRLQGRPGGRRAHACRENKPAAPGSRATRPARRTRATKAPATPNAFPASRRGRRARRLAPRKGLARSPRRLPNACASSTTRATSCSSPLNWSERRPRSGRVRIHAEVRLGHDPGATRLEENSSRKDALDRAYADVLDHLDPGAQWHPAAIDDRSVVQLVAHDDVARLGERGDGAEVCSVAAGEHQRRGDLQPRRQR